MSYKPLAQPPKSTEFDDPAWQRWFNDLRELSTRIDIITATLNPTSVGANGTSSQVFTVAGVKVGDIILQATAPTLVLIVGNPIVTDTDEITILFHNSSGGAVDPASETYTFTILKQTR